MRKHRVLRVCSATQMYPELLHPGPPCRHYTLHIQFVMIVRQFCCKLLILREMIVHYAIRITHCRETCLLVTGGW